MSGVFERVAAAAIEGARAAIEDKVIATNDPADLVVVVNVAWIAPDGKHLAVGTAIPEHRNDLLADSLRQSAGEADEAATPQPDSREEET